MSNQTINQFRSGIILPKVIPKTIKSTNKSFDFGSLKLRKMRYHNNSVDVAKTHRDSQRKLKNTLMKGRKVPNFKNSSFKPSGDKIKIGLSRYMNISFNFLIKLIILV